MTKRFRRGLLGLSLALSLCTGLVHAAAPDSTWARTYNPQGLVATLDGPRTDVKDITQYTYDTQGRLATVTDAMGHVTTYGNYDSFNHPGQITDPNQTVTVITYTAQEWPATITRDSAGTPSTTTLTYDASGDVTQTQDADGVILKYTYDNARRLTDITDGAGNNIHYTLDAAGNRTKIQTFGPSNTLMRTVSQSFTSLSQLLTVTDALSRTVLTYNYPDGYDAAGHPTHSADASGIQRTKGYDALNRLITIVDNANGTDPATQNTKTVIAYDSSDNLTGVTDPNGLATAYAYDGLGHGTALQSPDTGTSTDTFDAAGNRLVHTDAKGVVSTASYDALNRIASLNYSDATLNVTYAYDEANSVTGCASSAPLGRLTRMVENAVTTVYCYDPRGDVIQKLQITAAATDVTSYTPTLAGRLSHLTEPDGTVISESYNTLGQRIAVQVTPSGGSASTVVSNITYLPFGPISSYTLGNGQTVTRTFDATYALTDITSPTLNLHFARDAMGRILAEGNTAGAVPAAESYKYDPLSRLTEVDDANGNPLQTFTYNQTGDRLSKTGGLATGAYGYTTGTHQLNTIGSGALTSDANGNTTANSSAGQTFGYGYNGRNRLTVVQANGSTVGTYAYNALGQRIQKVATLPAATTQRFAYDEQNNLIGEYGSNTRDYVWISGIPVAVIDTAGGTSTINYVTADQLGTPRAVSNSAGTVIWSWAWLNNPFGEQAPTSTTGYVFNLRFPGQYFDAESGLLHNGYRDYCAACGRYIQSDPTGLNGGISTYAYVGSRPTGLIDPTGLQFEPVGAGDAAAGAGDAAAGEGAGARAGGTGAATDAGSQAASDAVAGEAGGLASSEVFQPKFDETAATSAGFLQCDGKPVAAGATLAGSDAQLASAAARITPQAGVFDVVVHGNANGFWVQAPDGSWQPITANQLSNFMNANGYAGEPIRLISCETGACGGTAAQNLSNQAGASVSAPSDTVWIHGNGGLTIGPDSSLNSGSWNTYFPGGNKP